MVDLAPLAQTAPTPLVLVRSERPGCPSFGLLTLDHWTWSSCLTTRWYASVFFLASFTIAFSSPVISAQLNSLSFSTDAARFLRYRSSWFLECISLTLCIHLAFIAAWPDLDYCARTAYLPLISTWSSIVRPLSPRIVPFHIGHSVCRYLVSQVDIGKSLIR